MTKVKKAPKVKSNVCEVVVKWYGDNGKPFGFARRADGVDLYLSSLMVEEAQAANILADVPQSGDILEVVPDEDVRGVFAAEILLWKPAPEVRGHVTRLTKDGHAIVKLDDTQEEALAFERIAKQVALEVGDVVLAVLLRDERGVKVVRVKKTGQKVELAPRTLKRGEPKSRLPQALFTGVYGYVNSYSKERGFGFIVIEKEKRTEDIGPEVFVCYRTVKLAQLPDDTLRDGDILQFDIFPGREAGKYEAQNLRLVQKKEWATDDSKPAVKSTKVPVYEALTGRVDWKEPEARYGFIVMDEPLPGLKPDMFLHVKDVAASGLTVADIIGTCVTFDVIAGRKPGELQATNLRNVVVPAAMGDLFEIAAQ